MERESDMILVRWKHFKFSYRVTMEQQRGLPGVDIVLLLLCFLKTMRNRKANFKHNTVYIHALQEL